MKDQNHIIKIKPTQIRSYLSLSLSLSHSLSLYIYIGVVILFVDIFICKNLSK